MKKATFLFLPMVIFSFVIVNGQGLKPSVLSSGGDISKSPGITLEWTLGEFAVETITSGKKIYTQGFHQPILEVKSFHSPPVFDFVKTTNPGFNIRVTPNPTQSFVHLLVQDELNDRHKISVMDMNGKILFSKQGNGHSYSMQIELGKYAAGVYLLDVRDKRGNQVGIFKIVKAD